MAQKRYTVVLSIEAKASLREGGRDSKKLRSVSKGEDQEKENYKSHTSSYACQDELELPRRLLLLLRLHKLLAALLRILSCMVDGVLDTIHAFSLAFHQH